MERFESLTQIFERARDTGREVRFIDGEKDETALTFEEVWDALNSLSQSKPLIFLNACTTSRIGSTLGGYEGWVT